MLSTGRILFLVVGLLVGWWAWTTREIEHPPGLVVAPDEPVQTAYDEPKDPWDHEGYRITPLARFRLTARLLGAERYRLDGGADLSPVDFALGWGRMSDTAVLDALSISQGGRFYRYQWMGSPPIPAGEIINSSANMHLIPATPEVRKVLLSARTGQIVTLAGHLVKAEGENGWRWQSSLTRSDSGGGACELVWVEGVRLERL